jgi:hypothetical protein
VTHLLGNGLSSPSTQLLISAIADGWILGTSLDKPEDDSAIMCWLEH